MTRVLIVEDSPTQAEELRFILDSEGFEVVAAADGQEGFDHFAESHFDLVISDIVMPGLSGYDLCRAIKSDLKSRETPVILLTSLSDPMDIIRGLECGADNFVTKPYEAPHLIDRIRSILENRRMRAEGKLRLGIEIYFLGRKFMINSDREQILDLLISTFEDTVRANLQLRAKEADLAAANARIEEYVRQLEERVRTSEEHFRTLVESIDDAVFTLDLQQRFTGVFGGWMARGGDSPRHYLGRTAGEVFGAEVIAENEAANARALAGERVTYEWTLGEGGIRYFHTSLSPLRGASGEVTGLVGVSREITEQKGLQAQLMVSDRMASVGMLAAGVAHEINNPLASVVANLDLIARDIEERGRRSKGFEELTEELKDAREGAERVRRIAGDLKVFSRPDGPEKLGPVDVQRALESSIRMAGNEIRHRAHLVRDFATAAPVQANESRLGQVFLNLLVNAAQALPEGRADVNEIRVRTRLEASGRVVIDIADTGPGIPPEIMQRLFSPFVTTKPVGVGTGLGLAICHRIVTGFGGEIRVDTKLGKGTVFSVELHQATSPAEAAAVAPASSVATRRGRVLVVDDEPPITAAVRRILAADHEVTIANGAREALGILAKGQPFDVILCDLMMPEVTGMELHTELGRSAPDQAQRMIFLTGGAFTPRARAFLEETSNQRLEKPFDAKSLRALVNSRIR